MELYKDLFNDEVKKIKAEFGEEHMKNSKFELAFTLFDELVVSEKFEEFLTLLAYKHI